MPRKLILMTAFLAACPDGVQMDPPDSSNTPDSGVESCPAPNGLTLEHGDDILADETWAGDGTIHHVTQSITVRPSATLTIEPCARIELSADRTITVRGESDK